MIIANQNVDTSFFTGEKNSMTNQMASQKRKDYFYLDAFWRVNLNLYDCMSFRAYWSKAIISVIYKRNYLTNVKRLSVYH